MKVKDLVERLRLLDPEAPILTEFGDHGYKLLKYLQFVDVEFMPQIKGVSYESYHEYFDEASRTFETSEIIKGVVLS